MQKAASDRFVSVGLELGGKDPAYVRADVDVKWAAEEIVDGAIFNSGQSCCSVERVYVDEKIHDQFVAAARTVLKGYRLGDPMELSTNIGPVISEKSLMIIQAHIADALGKGANDDTPDNSTFLPLSPSGNFIGPTLLTGVNHDMDIMNDETFGPVIPVQSVGDDEEAIRLMNDSEFGLTASIWTKNIEKGEQLAERIEAGTVFVNRCDFPSPVGVLYRHHISASLNRVGPCMDGMEKLREGIYAKRVRLSAICETEKLSYQGPSEVRSDLAFRLLGSINVTQYMGKNIKNYRVYALHAAEPDIEKPADPNVADARCGIRDFLNEGPAHRNVRGFNGK